MERATDELSLGGGFLIKNLKRNRASVIMQNGWTAFCGDGVTCAGAPEAEKPDA